MINSVNNSPSFSGLAKLSITGKDAIVKKTTKEQDKLIKLYADEMSKRGVLLSPVSKEKANFFQKVIDVVMGGKFDYGDSSKYMSNMSTASRMKNSPSPNYLCFGDLTLDKPGSVDFILRFDKTV